MRKRGFTMATRTDSSPRPDRTVGIMVCPKAGDPPFPEKGYFRSLSLIGRQIGLSVIVFFPNRLDWERRRVVGYMYSPSRKRWMKSFYPLPKVVYDRCFYPNPVIYAMYREPIRRLMESRETTFLGFGLKGKWPVYQMLSQDAEIRRHLPETELMRSPADAARWLEMYGELILKPQGGSHGKGVLHIAASNSGRYTVRGRSLRNELIQTSFPTIRKLLVWVKAFTSSRPFVLQRYLTLTTERGEAFDIRALVQKNEKGLWELTGTAVRLGLPGSVTSNLHGGGRAAETLPFLNSRWGKEKAPDIMKQIEDLAQRIPGVLEQHHGRLAELGIDIGVDEEGQVWVLEVNSKPGRSAFAALPDKQAKLSSVRNPILYARYLLDRSSLRAGR